MKYIFVLFCFLFSFTSFACNCNPSGTIAENIAASDVIVKAKILSISYTDRLDTFNVVMDGDQNNVFQKYWKFHVKIYTAIIETTYKGKLDSDTISIVTGMNGANCGFVMAVNREYLVYGTEKDYLGFSNVQRRASDHKLIWTSNCTRSWLFSDEEAIEVEAEIERTAYRN